MTPNVSHPHTDIGISSFQSALESAPVAPVMADFLKIWWPRCSIDTVGVAEINSMSWFGFPGNEGLAEF